MFKQLRQHNPFADNNNNINKKDKNYYKSVRVIDHGYFSVTVTPPPPAQTSAIDLKIDQAMELVKTHLMFAVREEVDGLKNKISELESTVNKLEKENTLLKRNVPNHILRGLHS